MKIKVCGVCNTENMQQLEELPIDFIGFIFYSKSPRFAGNGRMPAEIVKKLPSRIRKTGVFVSESPNIVTALAAEYALDAVQLHGDESPADCLALKQRLPAETTLIKAFPIAGPADFAPTAAYISACDYFLFDTKTTHYGGSGRSFDWSALAAYRAPTPFFLSGGVSATDADRIRQISHPALFGVDLNSRFETAPGVKNITLLQTFIETLHA
jgi:phosphoribosylanthranilate isomerase